MERIEGALFLGRYTGTNQRRNDVGKRDFYLPWIATKLNQQNPFHTRLSVEGVLLVFYERKFKVEKAIKTFL